MDPVCILEEFGMGCISIQFLVALAIGAVMLVLLYVISRNSGKGSRRLKTMSSQRFQDERSKQIALAEADQKNNPGRYPEKKE